MSCNRFPPFLEEIEGRDLLYVYDKSSGTKRMGSVDVLTEYVSQSLPPYNNPSDRGDYQNTTNPLRNTADFFVLDRSGLNPTMWGIRPDMVGELPYYADPARYPDPKDDPNLEKKGEVTFEYVDAKDQELKTYVNSHTYQNWGTNSLGGNTAIPNELYKYGSGADAVIVYTTQSGVVMGVEPDDNFYTAESLITKRLHIERDLGWSTSEINNANALQRAIDGNYEVYGGSGTYVVSRTNVLFHDGEAIGAGQRFVWNMAGIKIKLEDGDWSSPPFVMRNMEEFLLKNANLDGNRANTTGNNAAFFGFKNIAQLEVDRCKVRELRRYAFSCTDEVTKPKRTNAIFTSFNCDDVGLHDGAVEISNGEVIQCNLVESFYLNGFNAKNTSGTGNGQLVKCFYSDNVKTENVHITDASPILFRPSMSFVRNNNVSHENLKILGQSKCGLEDNSNINYKALNVITTGYKALIMSPDGGAFDSRRTENLEIINWRDTCTDPLSFNITGAKNLYMKNVQSDQTINISRAGTDDTKRSQDVKIDNCSCDTLNLLLVTDNKKVYGTKVTNELKVTGPGTLKLRDTTYGTLSQSSGAEVVFIDHRTDPVLLEEVELTPGSSHAVTLNSVIENAPLDGFIHLASWFPSSPDTQSSISHFYFYDFGANKYVTKEVKGSGATPRNLVSVVTNRSSRTITFTNDDNVNYKISGVIYINPK